MTICRMGLRVSTDMAYDFYLLHPLKGAQWCSG